MDRFKLNVFKSEYSFLAKLKFIEPKKLRKALMDGLTGLDKAPLIINLVLADNDFLAKLNWDFRHKKGVTDVLSFDYRDQEKAGLAPKEEANVGEVFVAPDFVWVLKEPKEDPRVALIKTIAHGVLHLSGRDHQTKAEETRMHQEEAKVASLYFS